MSTQGRWSLYRDFYGTNMAPSGQSLCKAYKSHITNLHLRAIVTPLTAVQSLPCNLGSWLFLYQYHDDIYKYVYLHIYTDIGSGRYRSKLSYPQKQLELPPEPPGAARPMSLSLGPGLLQAEAARILQKDGVGTTRRRKIMTDILLRLLSGRRRDCP